MNEGSILGLKGAIYLYFLRLTPDSLSGLILTTYY